MREDMIKTKYDSIRAIIIKDLSRETEYSASFIRMAIRGERDSEAAEFVKKEYKRRYDKAVELFSGNTNRKAI